MTITRKPLREDVRDALLEMLARRVIPVGEDINEPDLVEQLGVSRTPLREALLSLERDGILEARPGRGWWVAPLSPGKAHDVYNIIGALEGLGVRATPSDAWADVVDELDRINVTRLDAVDDPDLSQRIDQSWHATLLSRCPNTYVPQTIAGLRQIVTFRYERARFTAGEPLDRPVAQHRAISEALRGGRLQLACALVEEHWDLCGTDLEGWIAQGNE